MNYISVYGDTYISSNSTLTIIRKDTLKYCNDSIFRKEINDYINTHKLKLYLSCCRHKSTIYIITDFSILDKVYHLNISHNKHITNINYLTNVNTLVVINCKNLFDVCNLYNLRDFNMTGYNRISDIGNLKKLETLYIEDDNHSYGLHLLRNLNIIYVNTFGNFIYNKQIKKQLIKKINKFKIEFIHVFDYFN